MCRPPGSTKRERSSCPRVTCIPTSEKRASQGAAAPQRPGTRGSGVTEQQGLFIGGRWSSPSTDEVLEVVSPHTEAVIARPAAAGPQDVDRAVAMARAAFDDGPWPRLDPSERIDAVRRLAARYDERRKDMAQLITSEMGAPISFSRFAQAT